MNGRHLNWLLMGSGRLLNVAVTAGATGYMDCTWFFTNKYGNCQSMKFILVCYMIFLQRDLIIAYIQDYR